MLRIGKIKKANFCMTSDELSIHGKEIPTINFLKKNGYFLFDLGIFFFFTVTSTSLRIQTFIFIIRRPIVWNYLFKLLTYACYLQ